LGLKLGFGDVLGGRGGNDVEVGVDCDRGSSDFGHRLDLLQVLGMLNLLGCGVGDSTARRKGSASEASEGVAEEESESELRNHDCD